MKETIKMLKNFRWKVRYENLEKKYNGLLTEYHQLEKQLQNDYANTIIRDKNKMIRRQKKIIKNLKEDYKKATAKPNEQR